MIHGEIFFLSSPSSVAFSSDRLLPLVTFGLSVNGRTEFVKLFLDCSRCLAGQCRYNGCLQCLGSSICLLRSLLLATVRLIAGS